MRFALLLILSICTIRSAIAQSDETDDLLMFSIYFNGGSFYIDELQAEELDEFIKGIENLEHHTITIHSHTDNIGGAEYNAWLSFMRGEMTIELLMDQEIMREWIEKKDFGQHNPIYDNSTWEGRRMNRRVDIIFWPIAM